MQIITNIVTSQLLYRSVQNGNC